MFKAKVVLASVLVIGSLPHHNVAAFVARPSLLTSTRTARAPSIALPITTSNFTEGIHTQDPLWTAPVAATVEDVPVPQAKKPSLESREWTGLTRPTKAFAALGAVIGIAMVATAPELDTSTLASFVPPGMEIPHLDTAFMADWQTSMTSQVDALAASAAQSGKVLDILASQAMQDLSVKLSQESVKLDQWKESLSLPSDAVDGFMSQLTARFHSFQDDAMPAFQQAQDEIAMKFTAAVSGIASRAQSVWAGLQARLQSTSDRTMSTWQDLAASNVWKGQLTALKEDSSRQLSELYSELSDKSGLLQDSAAQELLKIKDAMQAAQQDMSLHLASLSDVAGQKYTEGQAEASMRFQALLDSSDTWKEDASAQIASLMRTAQESSARVQQHVLAQYDILQDRLDSFDGPVFDSDSTMAAMSDMMNEIKSQSTEWTKMLDNKVLDFSEQASAATSEAWATANSEYSRLGEQMAIQAEDLSSQTKTIGEQLVALLDSSAQILQSQWNSVVDHSATWSTDLTAQATDVGSGWSSSVSNLFNDFSLSPKFAAPDLSSMQLSSAETVLPSVNSVVHEVASIPTQGSVSPPTVEVVDSLSAASTQSGATEYSSLLNKMGIK